MLQVSSPCASATVFSSPPCAMPGSQTKAQQKRSSSVERGGGLERERGGERGRGTTRVTKPNVTNYQQHIRLDWEGVDRKNRVGGGVGVPRV